MTRVVADGGDVPIQVPVDEGGDVTKVNEDGDAVRVPDDEGAVDVDANDGAVVSKNDQRDDVDTNVDEGGSAVPILVDEKGDVAEVVDYDAVQPLLMRRVT